MPSDFASDNNSLSIKSFAAAASRTKSSFKINKVKGFLQERFDSASTEIGGQSLKVVFGKNNDNGLRSNDIELFNERVPIRIRKMIFNNHNIRNGFLCKSQCLSGS